MKKLLFILLILLISCGECYPKENIESPVAAIEKTIFGYKYDNENETKRVERIEQYLYGVKKSGNIQNRINNIKNDIGFVPQKINKNKTENLDSSGSKNTNRLNQDLMNLKEDASVDYPVVAAMEQEVFNTTYKSENIYKRLDRLETKIYNKTSTESLNKRVERLAVSLNPQKHITSSQNVNSGHNLDNYYRKSGMETIDDQTMPFQLAVLEQELLRGNYTNDNISNRLSRLEQKLFKRTFTTDSDINRLQRIMVAYEAKKDSYKYENNRKMQNVATMSQIGGILLMILAILL